MNVYLLVLLNIILMVAGQSLWKIGLERVGGFLHLAHVLGSPYIWAGICLYGMATLVWLAVLAKLPLSLAYPLQSLAYVLGLLVAFYIFQEPVSFNRWIGV